MPETYGVGDRVALIHDFYPWRDEMEDFCISAGRGGQIVRKAGTRLFVRFDKLTTWEVDDYYLRKLDVVEQLGGIT